jgi:hypothetical protein
MSDSEGRRPVPPPGSAQAPATVAEGLVASVVNLVSTGPVELGAYTVAELTAVDAIVDFLAARPSDEVLGAEAADCRGDDRAG